MLFINSIYKKPINIVVQREENTLVNLTLTPKEWSGRGLLG